MPVTVATGTRAVKDGVDPLTTPLAHASPCYRSCMRSLVAVGTVATLALVLALAGCAKKPQPAEGTTGDAGVALVADLADAGAPPIVAPIVPVAPPVALPVDTVPAPMVIAGYNVPQPRGFRRAQPPDAIGSPQLEPWLARGDIVLIDEAAFPPGTIDIGFVSMLNLPATLSAEQCTTLAKRAAETEKAELVGAASLLETGLGPTCSYELKLAAGVARAALAVIEGRSLGIIAAHAAGDQKTSAAWSDVVKGMRKTSP